MGGSILSLAWRSLLNRRVSALLTVLAVALSVALFLGVEKARDGARGGFDNTISGTDLIVGAPTGELNLLLYSVFRLGNATANIDWETAEEIAAREDIAWTVPLSLGDSHSGFRVLGTNRAYFDRYAYGDGQSLTLQEGRLFDDIFDAVIGARVARELGYEPGSPLVLTHGLGQSGLSDHDHSPFRTVGVLAPTGTPVDSTIHVPLEGVTAMHVGWESGTRNPLADTLSEETIRSFDLTPHTVTAILVGLENRGSILRTRRALNTEISPPVLAIQPAQALSQLWEVTGVVETVLIAVSVFVVAVGLVSILVSLLTSLNERRREIAILRAAGASPRHVFALVTMEAGVLGGIGAIAGVLLIQLILLGAGPILSARYGIAMTGMGPGPLDLATVVVVTVAAFLLGAVPALVAVRRSLSDGLTPRL